MNEPNYMNYNEKEMKKNNYEGNGRINILGKVKDQFQLFEHPDFSIEKTSSYDDALTGNWEDNLLSKAFFSKDNIIIIQNGIKRQVYDKSNGRYLIAPQDETNLKIIMRSIFLQNAKNLPYNYTEQIKELNELVYKYCVPNILSTAISYLKYKNDVSTLPVPEARPVNVSVKGDKILENKRFM